MNEPVTRTKRGLDLATAAELGDLLHELSHTPATRKIIADAIKKAKPESAHARQFTDVEVEDKFETFKAEQEAKEVKRQQDAIVARMQAQRDKLINGDDAGHKYTEDDVKKIETLMQSKGITDYEDGRVLYAATLPPENNKPAAPPPTHGSTWDFPEWAKFGPDPVKASRDTANQVITEFMRAKR